MEMISGTFNYPGILERNRTMRGKKESNQCRYRNHDIAQTAAFLMLMMGVLCINLYAESLFKPVMDSWYPFTADNTLKDGALGLSGWNEKPAGARGRIAMQGDKLILGGEHVKLWGLNNEYFDTAPPKEVAEFRAAFYAKYGFNSIRLHKYNDGPGWAGFGTPASMVEFDPKALDQFDYYCSQLKKQGLYINLSSNFGVKIGPKDAPRFEAFEDFFDTQKGWSSDSRLKPGDGSIYLSPGLQSLHIEQMVKLLKHTNPYTGMTYAQDPAIAFVEIFNEDSILFYSTVSRIQTSPILRKYISRRFADWLKRKYGSVDAWHQGWGESAIISDVSEIRNNRIVELVGSDKLKGAILPENFENGVVPLGQPWFYDAVSRPLVDEGIRAIRQRILDTMEFLIGIQNEFNNQVTAAIRETGYEGLIIGSNWQAGSMGGHFWNLLSDSQVGIIDRHNYFGGIRNGLQLKDGMNPINNASQLDRPGSGLMSSGLQQVRDRAFMFSEWNVVQPNEWYLEGPAILSTYGMGMQGWDVSYIFAGYQKKGFSRTLDDIKKFSIDTPPILGVMPVFARMIRRQDVQESDRIASLNVSENQLRQGNLDFHHFIDQSHDLKSFDSDKIPTETLAAVRATVRFTDKSQPTDVFQLDEYRRNGGILSSTGQLFWTQNQGKYNDYFTINTKGTKGSIGFFQESMTLELGEITMVRDRGYGAVVVTADEQNKNLLQTQTALIVVMARSRNTGMAFNEEGTILEKVGQGPILLEPISAKVTFNRDIRQVRLLDHDGLPTERTARVEGRTLTIDGRVDRTPYYQVIFD
jgi:hypothetical protein